MSTFDYAVIMPKMSMTMEEGELLAIRVNVGDLVKSGDVLFDVATDKIDMAASHWKTIFWVIVISSLIGFSFETGVRDILHFFVSDKIASIVKVK